MHRQALVYQDRSGDTLFVMVKKYTKIPLPESARRIAVAIKGLMAERDVTQQELARVVGDPVRGARAQSYISTRVNGLDAWDSRELELIAVRLGFADAFDLIDEARRRTRNVDPDAQSHVDVVYPRGDVSVADDAIALDLSSAEPQPQKERDQ
jgi:hypothetical protein